MALTKNLTVACLAVLLLAGCSGFPVASNWKGPDILVVYPDGHMSFHNHPVPRRDVVIYPDGYGDHASLPDRCRQEGMRAPAPGLLPGFHSRGKAGKTDGRHRSDAELSIQCLPRMIRGRLLAVIREW